MQPKCWASYFHRFCIWVNIRYLFLQSYILWYSLNISKSCSIEVRANKFTPLWFQSIFLSGATDAIVSYTESKQFVNRFSLRFYTTIAILFIIVLGMPFHVAFYHVIRGTYNSSVWFLPYKVLYVWKEKKLAHFMFRLTSNFLHFHTSGCRSTRMWASDMRSHWPHKFSVF